MARSVRCPYADILPPLRLEDVYHLLQRAMVLWARGDVELVYAPVVPSGGIGTILLVDHRRGVAYELATIDWYPDCNYRKYFEVTDVRVRGGKVIITINVVMRAPDGGACREKRGEYIVVYDAGEGRAYGCWRM